MRYYVVADIHGFYTEFKQALEEKGFFEDTQPHKLIVCGDLYDRGSEAQELQSFILDLMAKDEVILIQGNHEDLSLQLLNDWHRGAFLQAHHHSNGTLDTLTQLTGCTVTDMFLKTDEVGHKYLHNDFIQKIIPSMLDYYETNRYIFVHGWIPCQYDREAKTYELIKDWRNATKEQWNEARWINGMEAAYHGIIDGAKTIVCGHWHTSFGHSKYEQDGSEYEEDANFKPYYANGIIALDGCTAISKIVNCIVIED